MEGFLREEMEGKWEIAETGFHNDRGFKRSHFLV
ncbi:unnamed protein product [Spirodela intermedia]|uniref:Uncharacterized protein n=1 Tax=Spirodela intermedia TaxID=51605 RepID=A0A7I8JVU0_SPIIN|nr:unnamed protein product [Spirodela intermedia]